MFFRLKDMKFILILLVVLFAFSACGDDRAAASNEKNRGVQGVSAQGDSDRDGLQNEDEINIYDTNVTNADTDSDGLKDGEEILTYDTNATNADTDGDGLNDWDEIFVYDTNATNADTDGDGLKDGDEILTYDTNATNADMDGDGLKDGDEILTYDTNVTNADSDGDGLNDWDEIFTYDTNATNADTDGDGLSDGEEILTYDTNATNADMDGDGLNDGEEIFTYDTNATNADTDGDGLSDGDEILTYDTNATNADMDGDGLNDGEEILTYDTNVTNADSDGDGLKDGEEILTYDTNATNADSDGDGLKDREEILTYDTNATNADTDGDDLKDGDEILTYDTNATIADTDGDGLKDGEEIFTHQTDPKNADSDNDGLVDSIEVGRDDLNATNADTDGDCLLDGFEVLNYETNASQKDTDGDGVDDGIEIYSYVVGEFNTTCLTTPETKESGFNPHPAIDGIPNIQSDIINALDPSNDSDGDGQGNEKENNCTEGNPLDSTKRCPFITDDKEARILQEHGYAYIPGGFDVDGDGVNEGGFWMSRYQARSSGIMIPSETVIEKVGNINHYVSRNFKVLNRNVQVTSYDEKDLSETTALAGNMLIFDEESVAGNRRISHMTPYLALVCLHEYKLKDQNNTELDLNITMPTLKQYMQVKQLLDADLANNGDGRHVRNGLLGTDTEVPLFIYSVVIDEFGKEHKEYLRNLVQLRDTFGHYTFDKEEIPAWWDVDLSLLKFFPDGAHSTQDLGNGIGPDKDPYGVIVRGGTILDVSEGVAGALTDDEGKNNGISFRAVTPYLY